MICGRTPIETLRDSKAISQAPPENRVTVRSSLSYCSKAHPKVLMPLQTHNHQSG